jgi:hypothetical protein
MLRMKVPVSFGVSFMLKPEGQAPAEDLSPASTIPHPLRYFPNDQKASLKAGKGCSYKKFSCDG